MLTTTLSEIASSLNERRASLGISYLELTRQSGVSRQAIYRLFHGQDVQLTTLLAVCKVLQINLLTVPAVVSYHLGTAPEELSASNAGLTSEGKADHIPSALQERLSRLSTGLLAKSNKSQTSGGRR